MTNNHITADEIKAAGGLAGYERKTRPKGRASGLRAKGPNELELRFQSILSQRFWAGELLYYAFVGNGTFRLPLVEDTTYNPDFIAIRIDGTVEVHEVKGRYEHDDGSRIKFKIAREKFGTMEFHCWKETPPSASAGGRTGLKEILKRNKGVQGKDN